LTPTQLDDLEKCAASWEPKGLSKQHLVMCEYHLAGMTNREIAARLGYHEMSVGLVLRSEKAQEYLAGRVQDLNNELQGQFRKVVRNLGAALDHESPDVNLKATDMWFRAHGRYAPKSAARDEGPVSAEDVVSKLLERAKIVQVNIDNRRVTQDEPPPALDDYSFLEGSK
jgi:hypothetical protein